MEARYVKVASRFFLVGKAAGSAGAGDSDGGLHRHFLDACFLCKRDISGDRHIFMYKGDAAFCSDECKQDQRDMDAALKAARRRQRHLLRRTGVPATASALVVVVGRGGSSDDGTGGGDATPADDRRWHARPHVPVVVSG